MRRLAIALILAGTTYVGPAWALAAAPASPAPSTSQTLVKKPAIKAAVQVAPKKPAIKAAVQVAPKKPAIKAAVQVAPKKPAIKGAVHVAPKKPAIKAAVQVAPKKPAIKAAVQTSTHSATASSIAMATKSLAAEAPPSTQSLPPRSATPGSIPLTGDSMASVPVLPPPPPPPNQPSVPLFNPLAELPGATPAPDFVPVPAATLALPVAAAYYLSPLPEAAPTEPPVSSSQPAGTQSQATLAGAPPRPAPQPAASPPAGPDQEAISLQRQGPGINLDTTFFPRDQDLYMTATIPQTPQSLPQSATPAPAAPTASPAPQAAATTPQSPVPQTPVPVPVPVPQSAASESVTVLSLYATTQELAYAHNFELATITLDRALTLEPTNPMLLALLGSLYYRQGAIDLARETWAQALVYDPTMTDVRTALGRLSAGTANGNN